MVWVCTHIRISHGGGGSILLSCIWIPLLSIHFSNFTRKCQTSAETPNRLSRTKSHIRADSYASHEKDRRKPAVPEPPGAMSAP